MSNGSLIYHVTYTISYPYLESALIRMSSLGIMDKSIYGVEGFLTDSDPWLLEFLFSRLDGTLFVCGRQIPPNLRHQGRQGRCNHHNTHKLR